MSSAFLITISEIRSSIGDIPSQLYTTDIGQEGHWYFDGTGALTEDNTGTILVTADLKRFRRVFDGALNVKWFGAKGDGVTDDTGAIQAAINFGGITFFPEGVFMIDAVTRLTLKNNSYLKLSKGAIVKAIPNNASTYYMIYGLSLSNITIEGGMLQGERDSHSGTTGEQGYAINLVECVNYTIRDISIKDTWGDGITLTAFPTGWCENGYIENVNIDRARRNGISIISAKNLIINKTKISNTNGTAPECGIDFEPNYTTQKLEGIVLNGVTTEYSKNAGIIFYLINNMNVDVIINDHVDNFSDVANVYVGALPPNQQGRIIINNPLWQNSLKNGLRVDNKAYSSAVLQVYNPTIVNANRLGAAGVLDNNAITISASNNGSTYNEAIGNVFIYSARVQTTDVTKKVNKAFYLFNFKVLTPDDTVRSRNVVFSNPLDVSGAAINNIIIDEKGQDIVIEDEFEILKVKSGITGISITPTSFITGVLHPSNASINSSLTLSNNLPIGLPLFFENRSPNYTLNIGAGASAVFYPSKTPVGTSLSVVEGESIVIKRIGIDKWHASKYTGFVSSNGAKHLNTDGLNLSGMVVQGAISTTVAAAGIGFPSASGQVTTFNGFDFMRSYSIYVDIVSSKMFIQRYNSTGVGQGWVGLINQSAASADTAANAAGATPTQAEFNALLAELRDLKVKMRSAGLLA